MLREDRRKGDGDWLRKAKWQRRIGMKKRDSVFIRQKEGAKRRETEEEKLIGRRRSKIEAGGRRGRRVGHERNGRREAAERWRRDGGRTRRKKL